MRYKLELKYNQKTELENFEIPFAIEFQNKEIMLDATNPWKKSKLKVKNSKDIIVLRNSFYTGITVK